MRDSLCSFTSQPGPLRRLWREFLALVAAPRADELHLAVPVDLRKFHANRNRALAPVETPALIPPALIRTALVTGAWLRTRGGQRVRLTGHQVALVGSEQDDPRPLTGQIALRGADGRPEWCDCAWFSSGAHTLYEHDWDLVALDVATCDGCGCDDLHACATSDGPCHWVDVDRDTGHGMCSRCVRGDAA